MRDPCGSMWFSVVRCSLLCIAVAHCGSLRAAVVRSGPRKLDVGRCGPAVSYSSFASSWLKLFCCGWLCGARGGVWWATGPPRIDSQRSKPKHGEQQPPAATHCVALRAISIRTYTLASAAFVGQHSCQQANMSSPGVEPGLSRPQSDVLTIRRWGPGVHMWLAHKLLATELQSTLRAAVASMRNITQVTIRSPGIEPGTI